MVKQVPSGVRAPATRGDTYRARGPYHLLLVHIPGARRGSCCTNCGNARLSPASCRGNQWDRRRSNGHPGPCTLRLMDAHSRGGLAGAAWTGARRLGSFRRLRDAGPLRRGGLGRSTIAALWRIKDAPPGRFLLWPLAIGSTLVCWRMGLTARHGNCVL